MLVDWKRDHFGAHTWMISDYGFRGPKKDRLFVEARESRAYIAQEKLGEKPEDISDQFLEYASALLGDFGFPKPRSDGFDAAFTLSHVSWNAAVMNEIDDSRDHVQEAKNQLENVPMVKHLIDKMVRRKLERFGSIRSLLGTYDYTPQKDGTIKLWVETHIPTPRAQ